MKYSKEQVYSHTDSRIKELDMLIATISEERDFMQFIRQANDFGEPLRSEALEVLFDQYKKIYG